VARVKKMIKKALLNFVNVNNIHREEKNTNISRNTDKFTLIFVKKISEKKANGRRSKNSEIKVVLTC
jgi:hypothetical protein